MSTRGKKGKSAMSSTRNRLKAYRSHQEEDSSLVSSWKKPSTRFTKKIKSNASIDCGWGNLLFAHTFKKLEEIKDQLLNEKQGQRNIALYLPDPHVLLSMAPQELFLDPSHTYRIKFEHYRPSKKLNHNIYIRRIENEADLKAINRIYAKLGMVPVSQKVGSKALHSRHLTYLLAEDSTRKEVVGAVMGVDHVYVFNDPEKGSSLWSLAVDPTAKVSGVGEALARYLIEHYHARGRNYLDLSVMHNNSQAIALYEKLNFKRIPVFCVKSKSAINEPLFIAPASDRSLNPYAQIITNEARRRGIAVSIDDPDKNLFTLTFGGRSIQCWESLSELTDAMAMLRCTQKDLTYSIMKKNKIRVPNYCRFSTKKAAEAFLQKHERIVVKPIDSEQGRGISVDVRSKKDLHAAIDRALEISPHIQMEEFVDGQDLRVVVIDYKVVAASLRIPPIVVGNGRDTIRSLITKLSRRRKAASGGESEIPLDAETERCLRLAGYRFSDKLKQDQELQVRKTANLHTGGILIDVTHDLHEKLVEVSEKAARALRIPVTGLDFIVKDYRKSTYHLIEANERPGLANHEPQPTAERFVDLLFPQTKRGKRR